MRVLVLCSLVACAGTSPMPRPAAPPVAVVAPADAPLRAAPRPPVDVIAALSADPQQTTWLVPGPASLVLGGASVQASEGAPTLEVEVFEQQGNDARVGVRLDSARFALWTSRARLLAVLSRDERVDGEFSTGADSIEVVLFAGAQVRRLAHEGRRTKIRYVGALEVEGWVPDEALGDRGAPGHGKATRIPTGEKSLMVVPGTVIRTEARWAGRQLAVMNEGYFIDSLNELDDGWHEVAYEDSDVRVHGFASTRDPPGRTHPIAQPEPLPPTFTPNTTLAPHTCLFAGGEPVGFVVGNPSALVEPSSRTGWMTLTLETPWGPLPFEGRGADASTLDVCGT